jgi:photosystem II stability/assembly factor-like uncharacterized protein
MPSPSHVLLLAAAIAAPVAAPARATAQRDARTTSDSFWQAQSSPTTASLRGLSVVSDQVAWASGTGGTFVWTSDAGEHWHAGTVPGAASLDFRDVHATSLDTAYLMAAGQDTARIYRTVDRGVHWTLQYENLEKGAFLDAIAFFDSRRALAIGDPIAGRFLLLRTQDAGAHWVRVAPASAPSALDGEAAFAASGTALVTCGPHEAWFATGGAAIARVLRSSDDGRSWRASAAPVRAGSASAGIFSIACTDGRHGVVVGGNYAHPDSTVVVAAATSDGGASWRPLAAADAAGYFSGVAALAGGRALIAVGTVGTGVSLDEGAHWTRTDSLSLNAVAVAPGRGPRRVWGVGARGRIVTIAPARTARLLLHPR